MLLAFLDPCTIQMLILNVQPTNGNLHIQWLYLQRNAPVNVLNLCTEYEYYAVLLNAVTNKRARNYC